MQKTNYLILTLICGAMLFSSCGGKFEKLRKNGTIQTKYKAAIAYMKKKDFDKAGILFEDVVPLLSGDTLQEPAMLMQAECDFEVGNYTLSSYKYKKFAETFARSPSVEKALYMSALSLYMDSPQHNLDQANTKAAIDELQTFVNNNPSSEYRSQTQDRIKELRKKLEKKAYEIAKLYYKTSPSSLLNLKSSVIAIENFQKDFPDSDYNEEMAFLKVQAEYELAKSSFAEKQKERFGEVKKFYDSLAEKFPGSKYIKMAESMSVDSQKRLEVIALAEAKEKAEREKNKPVQNTTKVAGSGN